MSKLILSKARSLRTSVKPPGAADSVVDARINQVCERFLNSGKWKGTLVTAVLAVYGGTVTLPSSLETILGVDYAGTPRRVSPLWYQFIESGPGMLDAGKSYHGATDLGANFVTFRDLPSAGRVKVYTSASGESGSLNVRGISGGDKVFTGQASAGALTVSGTLSPDATGVYAAKGDYLGHPMYGRGIQYFLNWSLANDSFILHAAGTDFDDPFNFWTSPTLTGTYTPMGTNTGVATVTLNPVTSVIEGEDILLPVTGDLLSASGATSETVFDAGNSLYALVKPTTQGVLSFYHVSATGVETLIGRYEPGETTPKYRRYNVVLETEVAVLPITALCKRAHVDAVAANDEVIPGNLGALKLGLLALNYEDQNDMERAQLFWASAFKLLNDETTERNGPESGMIHITTKGWGAGGIGAIN